VQKFIFAFLIHEDTAALCCGGGISCRHLLLAAPLRLLTMLLLAVL
jgi:hypothetical protein